MTGLKNVKDSPRNMHAKLALVKLELHDFSLRVLTNVVDQPKASTGRDVVEGR